MFDIKSRHKYIITSFSYCQTNWLIAFYLDLIYEGKNMLGIILYVFPMNMCVLLEIDATSFKLLVNIYLFICLLLLPLFRSFLLDWIYVVNEIIIIVIFWNAARQLNKIDIYSLRSLDHNLTRKSCLLHSIIWFSREFQKHFFCNFFIDINYNFEETVENIFTEMNRISIFYKKRNILEENLKSLSSVTAFNK